MITMFLQIISVAQKIIGSVNNYRSPKMVLVILLSIFLFLLLLALNLRFNHDGRLISKLPGPKPWPIFGNIFDMLNKSQGDIFNLFRAWNRDYGDIMKITGFHRKFICVFNPQDAEAILSGTRFLEKDEPYIIMRPWLNDGILLSKKQKWLIRRKLLTPAFHFNILKKFMDIFNKHTEKFINKYEKEVEKDKTDPHPPITELTLATMCETSMGIVLDEVEPWRKQKYIEGITTLGTCLIQQFTRFWYYNKMIFNLSPLSKIQEKALIDVHQFTSEVIARRREKKLETKQLIIEDTDDSVYSKKQALLDLLLDYEKEGKIDDEGIREEVDTFMFEGHDTTAMALLFMIVQLANEPKIQDKIYEELFSIFGDSKRPATTDDLNQMKYLDLCIKETLRLYPSVPLIMRTLDKEVVLSGYTIPAKTIAAICIFDIHRRADIYPEPEKFIPERFLPENMDKLHTYAYIPFSAGPRNCIGQKFAIYELKTVMSGLLRRFKFEPITKIEDIEYSNDIVLRPLNPMYVKFRNRNINVEK